MTGTKYTLKSSDDRLFIVDMSTVKQMMTVVAAVDAADAGSASQPIPLPNVNADVLEKVLEWCDAHKKVDIDAVEIKLGITQPLVLSDDEQTFFADNDAIIFEIIAAANYLDVWLLLEQSCLTVANKMKGKRANEMRDEFNVVDAFTDEEEREHRKANVWVMQ